MPKFSKQQCLNLYYYDAENNFGDQLNVDLFRYFGKQVKRKSPSKADIVAIGSLLQSFICKKISLKKKIKLFFSKPLIVYGTGFIEPDTTKLYSNRKLDVRAVRGKLSLGRLQALKNINIPANIALGDPGLLISKMFDVSHIEKKYDLGIIPHYVDQNSPLLENISVKNSIVLDITQRPEDLLPQIASCKNILSSAMHGLIAADALLIPNMRMILSDKIVGKDYKYDDYYSVFGIENHNRTDLTKETFTDADLPKIKENYKINSKQIAEIQKNLINAFPYQINLSDFL